MGRSRQPFRPDDARRGRGGDTDRAAFPVPSRLNLGYAVSSRIGRVAGRWGLAAAACLALAAWRTPDYPVVMSNARLEAEIGHVEFRELGSGRVQLDTRWERANLVRLRVPMLAGVRGAAVDGSLYVHRRAAWQLNGISRVVLARGLQGDLLTFGGSFSARHVASRPSGPLSRHSYAMALDLNPGWNRMGARPAPVGSLGNVYRLVPVFEAFGFCWGGRWRTQDGMHFEVTEFLDSAEVERRVHEQLFGGVTARSAP